VRQRQVRAGLGVPGLALQRPAEQQVQVAVVGVPVEQVPQRGLGAAQLGGAVVRAGEQE
jgi:hypothetical protein